MEAAGRGNEAGGVRREPGERMGREEAVLVYQPPSIALYMRRARDTMVFLSMSLDSPEVFTLMMGWMGRMGMVVGLRRYQVPSMLHLTTANSTSTNTEEPETEPEAEPGGREVKKGRKKDVQPWMVLETICCWWRGD